MKPGKYVIIKHPFWCIDDAELVVVTSYNEKTNSVNYYYPSDKNGYMRSRDASDFEEGVFIPASTLLELLF
jgi:hypothetical protein